MQPTAEIEALVASAMRLWSGDRHPLYAALVATMPSISRWRDELADAIADATERVVRSGFMVSDEVEEALGSGADALIALDWETHASLGDPSIGIRMLLTPGIDDIEAPDLAACGGRARVATFTLSAVLPVYTLAITEFRHEPKTDVWTEVDAPVLTDEESSSVDQAAALVRKAGFRLVPRDALDQPVPGAWTDLCEPGTARLADCLFSDIHRHDSGTWRWTGATQKDVVPGFALDWKERRGAGGELVSRQLSIGTESGESITLDINGDGAVTSVRHTPTDSASELLRSSTGLRRLPTGRLRAQCRRCETTLSDECAACAAASTER